MKVIIILYIISLIFIVTSMLLVLEYPNSGRIQVIAGALASSGILLNIIAFILKSDKKISK